MTIPNQNKLISTTVASFKALDQRLAHYKEILDLVGWDMQTKAPKKGKSYRSQAVGTLSSDMYHISLSEEMERCLTYLSTPDVFEQLDEATSKCVKERKTEFDKLKKIPADLYKEFVIHAANAQEIWEEARHTNNFALYQPALEKMVKYQKKFIEYFGYEKHPYDALLNEYEPGLTVQTLDPLFADLRTKTIDLLVRIQASPHQPKTDLFNQHFDVEKQKEFSLFVLTQLGFDLNAGRLDVSAHPFASGINISDVRITTRYLENDMRSAIFGTIHECGHALYEQGINPDYQGTSLAEGTSMGIHESQSRFMENVVGRSYEFWSYLYNDLQQFFPAKFDGVELEEFCRAINVVQPSLVRVEADELTYNLHIIVRYEIEKGLMAGEFEVKDLPQIWNSKMKEYLGVSPDSDAEGVLQDVHWSFGGFGYFPSYSLGNLYAAQIAHTMRRQLPNFDLLLEQGEFLTIREWLRENIHQHGKFYSPHELIKKVTGEDLNAKYLIDYFEEKYSKVYKL
jgi:carboxypeptidase Taq